MQRRWCALLAILGWLVNPALAENRIAIIIDDIGYNRVESEQAAKLAGNFTLSILPFTPHGKQSAELAHQLGKEVMLHIPMSNLNQRALGQGGLYSGMRREDFTRVLQQNIANVPYIRGVNNHMGSQLTQEAEPMEWLMEALRPHKLYFVDSRTSAQTKAFAIAQTYSIPSLKRDVFLDDDQRIPAIEAQLQRAIQLAKTRGSAVAIGHPYPNTLAVLSTLQPLLLQHNVTLVFTSALLKLPLNNTQINQHSRSEKQLSNNYCAAPPLNLWTKPRVDIHLMQLHRIGVDEFFSYYHSIN